MGVTERPLIDHPRPSPRSPIANAGSAGRST